MKQEYQTRIQNEEMSSIEPHEINFTENTEQSLEALLMKANETKFLEFSAEI